MKTKTNVKQINLKQEGVNKNKSNRQNELSKINNKNKLNKIEIENKLFEKISQQKENETTLYRVLTKTLRQICK